MDGEMDTRHFASAISRAGTIRVIGTGKNLGVCYKRGLRLSVACYYALKLFMTIGVYTVTLIFLVLKNIEILKVVLSLNGHVPTPRGFK